MLEHVAGNTKMMHGVISRLIDFLKLTEIEAILAGLVFGIDGSTLWT